MQIDVKLPQNREYPVFIDHSGSFIEHLKKEVPATAYVFVTNKTIKSIYSDSLSQWESQLPNSFTITVEDGESQKSLETLNIILTSLLEKQLDRKTALIAFGGGVIGDMTGFAASIFLRGVPFVQLPTTLLAMVDSSVGGKTAVNHPMGKNLIGTFYQPSFVWIDTNFLKTLPDREYLAGCGEIFKYGFIGGLEMFDLMREGFKALCQKEQIILQDSIRRSVEIKAQIVARDEKEQGDRALLNFGHTFGHALEKVLGFGTVLHGEAVLWGIGCAIKLGLKLKTVPESQTELYNSLIEETIKNRMAKGTSIDNLYRAMFSDKKTSGGRLRFVVPAEAGRSIIIDTATKEEIISVLEEML